MGHDHLIAFTGLCLCQIVAPFKKHNINHVLLYTKGRDDLLNSKRYSPLRKEMTRRASSVLQENHTGERVIAPRTPGNYVWDATL